MSPLSWHTFGGGCSPSGFNETQKLNPGWTGISHGSEGSSARWDARARRRWVPLSLSSSQYGWECSLIPSQRLCCVPQCCCLSGGVAVFLLILSRLSLLPLLTQLGSPIHAGQWAAWPGSTCVCGVVCLPSHKNACPPAHWELCCHLPGDPRAGGLVLPHCGGYRKGRVFSGKKPVVPPLHGFFPPFPYLWKPAVCLWGASPAAPSACLKNLWTQVNMLCFSWDCCSGIGSQKLSLCKYHCLSERGFLEWCYKTRNCVSSLIHSWLDEGKFALEWKRIKWLGWWDWPQCHCFSLFLTLHGQKFLFLLHLHLWAWVCQGTLQQTQRCAGGLCQSSGMVSLGWSCVVWGETPGRNLQLQGHFS